MEIKIKIFGEQIGLLESLIAHGFVARLVKGGIICNLGWEPALEKKFIPQQIQMKMFTILIDCEEHGGGATNTGCATVVCGLSGKKLKPYLVPTSGHLANGSHAFFSVPESVVTITGYRKDNLINIDKHKIVHEKVSGDKNNYVSLVTKPIWSGNYQELPERFAHYSEAVKAAKQKAGCYHCRGVHYALTGKEEGGRP